MASLYQSATVVSLYHSKNEYGTRFEQDQLRLPGKSYQEPPFRSFLNFEYNYHYIHSKELYIVKPKATCHITKQASINARASVRYPI